MSSLTLCSWMLYSRKISVWNCNWFVSIKYDLLLTRGLFYYFKIDHLSYNHLSYNHLSYNHLSYNHLSYTERERSFFIQFILSTLNSPTHYLSYTSFVLQRGDNRSFFVFFHSLFQIGNFFDWNFRASLGLLESGVIKD